MKRCREKGEEEGWPAKGKEKRTHGKQVTQVKKRQTVSCKSTHKMRMNKSKDVRSQISKKTFPSEQPAMRLGRYGKLHNGLLTPEIP